MLGGTDCDSFEEVYGDVDVIHPGSLAAQSSYAVYYPGRDRSSPDSDDDDDDSMLEKAQRVEFYHLGDEAINK